MSSPSFSLPRVHGDDTEYKGLVFLVKGGRDCIGLGVGTIECTWSSCGLGDCKFPRVSGVSLDSPIEASSCVNIEFLSWTKNSTKSVSGGALSCLRGDDVTGPGDRKPRLPNGKRSTIMEIHAVVSLLSARTTAANTQCAWSPS
jgi:hypothetical protein